mmetsp:Transcript_60868/g.128795  ORF Transcript_60868/g.128795 Transcript_60868/m.128795 type:complete len:155 (-) Transcript_60868:68-532(-)
MLLDCGCAGCFGCGCQVGIIWTGQDSGACWVRLGTRWADMDLDMAPEDELVPLPTGEDNGDGEAVVGEDETENFPPPALPALLGVLPKAFDAEAAMEEASFWAFPLVLVVAPALPLRLRGGLWLREAARPLLDIVVETPLFLGEQAATPVLVPF